MRSLVFLLCLALQDRSATDWIEQLRSDEAGKREEAARGLLDLGQKAVPDLERALKDKDPEVSRRAAEVLARFKAEGARREIREKIAQAKSVSIHARTTTKMTIRGVANDEAGAITVLLKEGNKAYLNARLLGANSHIVATLVSDGRKLSIKWTGKAWEELDTPPDLNRRLAIVLAETGFIHPVYVTFHVFTSAKMKTFESPFKVSQLRLTEGGVEGSVLKYVLGDQDGTRDMTEWFDPESHALLRVASGSENPKVRSFTEARFSRWELGGEIPDERFAPPIPGKSDEDRIDQAKAMLKTLRDKLEAYEDDAGGYPTTEQGLEALLEKPTKAPVPKSWSGPYLQASAPIMDPWGNPYLYRFPGALNPRKFDLLSSGPDGKPGTGDDLR